MLKKYGIFRCPGSEANELEIDHVRQECPNPDDYSVDNGIQRDSTGWPKELLAKYISGVVMSKKL
jgi:hypothetical protein